MSEDKRIYFIVEEPTTEEVDVVEGERGGRDTGGGWGAQPRRSRVDAIMRSVQRQRVGIETSALKTQVQDLVGAVDAMFSQDAHSITEQSDSGFQLEEITLSVQVSAKGKLSILGTGSEIGGVGGITLKFVNK